MDPYLEHPTLWSDVHDQLITALSDDLGEPVAPQDDAGLEQRTYLLKADDLVFAEHPDTAVAPMSDIQALGSPQVAPAVLGLEVDVPMLDEVSQNFLEIHEVQTGKLVTLVELLSPANTLHRQGGGEYDRKRVDVFRRRTRLVAIDLLRAGNLMAVIEPPVKSDYRILVSRGVHRPRTALMAFTLRQPIPSFALPLLPGEIGPDVELNCMRHDLSRRARFDLWLDYAQPSVPPLSEDVMVWAQAVIEASELGR